ncbi:MAG: DNA-binding protein, partial [Thermodesulfatator sp.]
QELERLTGVDRSTIQAWEKRWRFPTLRKFLAVAKALRKPLEYFFDET